MTCAGRAERGKPYSALFVNAQCQGRGQVSLCVSRAYGGQKRFHTEYELDTKCGYPRHKLADDSLPLIIISLFTLTGLSLVMVT